MEDAKYWVALHRVPNLGAVKFRLLESHFGTLDRAWAAGAGELKAAGLENRTAQYIVSHRDGISHNGEMEKLQRAGVKVINWHDPKYPPKLKEIYDPATATLHARRGSA